MVNQPVLIVDDEVEMRIAMSETLKHCGYPVEISHNAIDALKKFKQNHDAQEPDQLKLAEQQRLRQKEEDQIKQIEQTPN